MTLFMLFVTKSSNSASTSDTGYKAVLGGSPNVSNSVATPSIVSTNGVKSGTPEILLFISPTVASDETSSVPNELAAELT